MKPVTLVDRRSRGPHNLVLPSGERAHRNLIGLILTLVVVGVVLWLLNNYVPMDAKIKKIINVVVVIVVVIWLLQQFGLLGSLRDVRIR